MFPALSFAVKVYVVPLVSFVIDVSLGLNILLSIPLKASVDSVTLTVTSDTNQLFKPCFPLNTMLPITGFVLSNLYFSQIDSVSPYLFVP